MQSCHSCFESNAVLLCECGQVAFCSESCRELPAGLIHAMFCTSEQPTLVQHTSSTEDPGPSVEAPSNPVSSESAEEGDGKVAAEKMLALKKLMSARISEKDILTRPQQVREAFEAVFPIREYPFKVMGYNRGKTGITVLNKERTVALASLFPHQRLIRDSRGPYLSDGGAVIIAPTGAGKTAIGHAILANYSRQLIELKTPFRYYMNPDKVISGPINTRRSDYAHRTLIYVTKANLVGDVRKDLHAQNSRSRAAFEALMTQGKVPFSKPEDGKISYAPFNPNVNVMSFKKFGNMLQGKNAYGRNFWSGRNLDDADHLLPISLPEGVQFSGRTPVPTAYWKDENGNWTRGNRSHGFMRSLIEKTYNLSVRVSLSASSTPAQSTKLKEALLELVFSAVNSYPAFKKLAGSSEILLSGKFSVSQKQSSEGKGSATRPRTAVVLTASSQDLVWTPNFLPKLTDKLWETFISSIRIGVENSVKKIFGPRSKPELSAVYPVFSPKDGDAKGWRLQKEGKFNYRWVPSQEGDYEEFNPTDGLVVFMDEAFLLFAPDNLLRAEESFDPELMIQSFREGKGVVFFAGATIDAITGVRMGQALTALPTRKGKKILSSEEQKELDIFPDYEGDSEAFLDEIEGRADRLAAALAGKINIATVSGMRDLFPDKAAGDELNIYYRINNEHAAIIKEKLNLSIASLMSTINVPFALQEHHRLFTSLFDPDRLLAEFFGAGSKTGFPLGRALMQAMRTLDLGKAISELSGRGIAGSAFIEDTITALAGVMQALGYEWLYLIPNRLTDAQKETRRRLMLKQEELPPELRTVRFDPQGPMTSRHATAETIARLGLEDLVAVKTEINGVPTAPRFIVLSSDLLVRREETKPLETTQDFAEEALLSHDFALPFRIRNVQALKAFGGSQLLLSQFAGTTKPVLHFYPATAAAEQKAKDAFTSSGGLARFFESGGFKTPRFFIQRRVEDQITYQEVRFFGETEDQLVLDPNSFVRADLQPVAVEYLKMKEDFKSDARELIGKRFNAGLAPMRESNLRYLLITRQYGQGIDVFNCPEVFTTEPSPDRATDIQRDGRFLRPRSLAEHPYDQWVVRYHCLVATYDENVDEENKIFPTTAPLNEILASSYGNKEVQAVLRAVNIDPLEAVKNADEPLDPQRPLLPFQAVKILTEDPRLTIRRARTDLLFNSWAVDTNYNKVERETSSNPATRVYSPTNYVLSSDAVVSHIRSQIAELKAFPPAKSEAILRREYGLTHDYANVSEEDLPQFELERDEWVNSVLAPMRKRESDIVNYEAAIESFANRRVSQLNRRLAVDESNRTLSVSLGSKTTQIELTAFGGPAGVHPLAQLTQLVENGVARFDPGFSTTGLVTQETKKRTVKPKEGAGGPAKKKKSSGGQEEPVAVETRFLSDSELISLPTSTHCLPYLIGAKNGQQASVSVEELHSAGTAIDKVAAPDQEQEEIERKVLIRFESICRVLGLWNETVILQSVQEAEHSWARTKYEKIAQSIYEKLTGKTKAGNSLRLQSGVLSLFQYGILTLPLALETFAHGFHSYDKDFLRGLNNKQRGPFFDALGVELGKLYQISAPGNANASAVEKLKILLELEKLPSLRTAFIALAYSILASIRTDIDLDELADFFEKCVNGFRIKWINPERFMTQLRSLIETELKDRTFTLVDVFSLFPKIMTSLNNPLLKVFGTKDSVAALNALLEKMQAIGHWNIAVEARLSPEEKKALAEEKKASIEASAFAQRMSGGKYQDFEGKSKSELFKSVWSESGDDWPIKKWVNRMSQRLKLDVLQARDRLESLYLDSSRFSEFKAQYLELVSTKIGKVQPLLYYPDPKSKGVTVELSEKENSYFWVSSKQNGKIDNPVHLLLSGIKDRYPQLRVQQEMTAQELEASSLLSGLPDSLNIHFKRFGSGWPEGLREGKLILKLLKFDGVRVKELRDILKRTAVPFLSFLLLCQSGLSTRTLSRFKAFARRIKAWKVAADLALLVDLQEDIQRSELPVLRILDLFLSNEATVGFFESLINRVQVFCDLFNVSEHNVYGLVYFKWAASKKQSLSLDELILSAVEPVVDQLKIDLKKGLKAIANEEQRPEDVEMKEAVEVEVEEAEEAKATPSPPEPAELTEKDSEEEEEQEVYREDVIVIDKKLVYCNGENELKLACECGQLHFCVGDCMHQDRC